MITDYMYRTKESMSREIKALRWLWKITKRKNRQLSIENQELKYYKEFYKIYYEKYWKIMEEEEICNGRIKVS